MLNKPQELGWEWFDKIVLFLFVHSFYDAIKIFVDGWVFACLPVAEEVFLWAVHDENDWAAYGHYGLEVLDEVALST